MKVHADRDRCEGLGMCEAMAPDLFEVGDDGRVDVLDDSPAADLRAHVTAAVDACPVSALRLQG